MCSSPTVFFPLPAIVCPSPANQGVRWYINLCLSAGFRERLWDDAVWQCAHEWNGMGWGGGVKQQAEVIAKDGEETGAESPPAIVCFLPLLSLSLWGTLTHAAHETLLISFSTSPNISDYRPLLLSSWGHAERLTSIYITSVANFSLTFKWKCFSCNYVTFTNDVKRNTV